MGTQRTGGSTLRTNARRLTMVLALAAALLAWQAIASTGGWLGAASVAHAQLDGLGGDDDGDAGDGEDGVDDGDGLADDGDGTGDGDGTDDGLEGDDLGEEGLGDETLEDDEFSTAEDSLGDDLGDGGTPLGGVDAGFGGTADDGGLPLGLVVAVALLLAVVGTVVVRRARTT